MPSLIWSPRAAADLQRLYRFLLPKNPDAAQRAVKAIRAGIRRLQLQPHMGRPIEGMAAPYREWVVDFGNSGYVDLYRVDGDAITILAVRHQKEAGF